METVRALIKDSKNIRKLAEWRRIKQNNLPLNIITLFSYNHLILTFLYRLRLFKKVIISSGYMKK